MMVNRMIKSLKQTEEALEVEKSYFEQLFESAQEAIVMCDNNHRILRINSEFTRLFGYTRDEALGRLIEDLVASEDLIGEATSITNRVSQGHKIAFEGLQKRKDGTLIIVSCFASPIIIGNEQVGVYAIYRDITEHKQSEGALRESEEKFRSISASAQDAIIMMDNDGNISYWNEAAEKMFGYTGAEAIGRELHLFLAPKKYHDAYKKGFARFKKRGRGAPVGKTLELSAIRKDGTEFPIEISVSSVNVKGNWNAIGIVRDVTERRRAEELQREKHAVQRLAEEREIVAKIGRIIGSTLEIEEVYEQFAEEVRKIIPFDRIAILIIDHERGTYGTAYITGKDIPSHRPGDVAHLASSLTGEVVRTRSGQLIQTEDRDEVAGRFPGLLAEFQVGLRSCMAVPLISKDQIIGVLHLQSAKLNAYTEADVSLAESIGAQIAGAIANAQLYAERRRAEEQVLRQSAVLDAINKVFQQALTCETEEELARTCLDVAEALTNSKFGWIGEVNQEGRLDTIAMSNPGWDACKLPQSEAPLLINNMEIRGIWGGVLKDEQSLIVNDPTSHPDRVGTPKGHPRLTSFLGVPLKHRSKTIGMISLGNKELAYDSTDREDVETLSVAIVEALMRKRGEEALRESEEINRVLFSISNAVNTTYNLDELYKSIHQSLGRIIDPTNFFIALYDKERDSLLFPYWVDEVDPVIPEITDISDPDSPSHTAEVIRTGKPVLHTKEEFLEQLRRKNKKPMYTVSEIWLGVPLKIKGEVIGAMVVHSFTDPNRYSKRDIDILLSVSDQVALAIERKRAEEALRASEERFALAVQGTNEGLWDWDIVNNSLYWSPRLKELLGYADDELDPNLDNFLEGVLYPDDRERVRAALDAHLKDREPYYVEQRQLTKSGEYRWFMVRGKALWDEAGNPIRMVGSTTDITDRKEAEEALQRQKDYLDALQETSLGMINRLDLNELLEAIIERAASLIGAPNGYISLLEPIEKKLEVKVAVGIHRCHIGFRQKPDEGLAGRVFETGRPLVVDDYRCWPGRIQDVRFDDLRSAVGIPLKSGEQVVGAIGVYDSEEGKFGDGEVELLSRFASLASIALENARLYTSVQQELAERKRAEEKVKNANRRLIREMREREEFLRIVSHDLGAPVRNISGMAASILRKYGGKVGEDVRDRLMRIQRNAEHELGLIQDLLKLSRIKTRRERFEEVDLGELVRGVGDGLSHQLEEKGVTFKVAEELPVIVCERKRVMQVFQNLIDNACKYMDSNGGPRIEVDFEELDDSYRFSVSDNGIGIKEEDQERIFYVFNRLKNPTTTQVEGKGVGLSAVKAIVEAYGGEVWVESPSKGPHKGKKARGSTFYFTLAKDALRGRDG